MIGTALAGIFGNLGDSTFDLWVTRSGALRQSSGMPRRCVMGGLLAAVALGSLFAAPADAASLQPVANWGASGVPTYISMFIYVPDKLATNPPILVVNHFCGGSASAVFGEAQGGGIVAAADKYGFMMIFPQTSTGNCWDVGSPESLTHDGGGDTQAIAADGEVRDQQIQRRTRTASTRPATRRAR